MSFFGFNQPVNQPVASVVQSESFDDVMASLKQAVSEAKSRNIGNEKFHTQEVLPALNQINIQIDEIIKKIKAYQQRLQGMEGEIGENRKKLDEINVLRRQLLEKETIIKDQENNIQAQLASNQAEMSNLKQQTTAGEEVFQEQMANLRQRLDNEKQSIATAKDDDARRQLEEKEADTLQRIQELQSNHANEKSAIQQQIQEHVKENADLRANLDKIGQENAANISNLTAANQTTEQVRIENQILTSQLEAAKNVMKEAIIALNSLENFTSIDQIRAVISSISSKIGQINSILDSNPQSNRNIEYENLEEYFEANEGPTQESSVNFFTLDNGTKIPIKQIIAQLKNKPQKGFMGGPSKYNTAFDLITKLDKKDPSYIPNIKNVLNRQGISFTQNNDIKGGKKTRHNRKSCKGGRKTCKGGRKTCKGGRKTKKMRKQKGGYHYNESTKRRSLTATSTSKRSKRRTKRTTSF